MDKLAEFLIEKETITGKEFMEIFRKEKGIPEPEEEKKETATEEEVTPVVDVVAEEGVVEENVESEETVGENIAENEETVAEETDDTVDENPNGNVGIFSGKKVNN